MVAAVQNTVARTVVYGPFTIIFTRDGEAKWQSQRLCHFLYL